MESVKCPCCNKTIGKSYSIWKGAKYHIKCVKSEIVRLHPEWLED
jgi:hypothetical protein